MPEVDTLIVFAVPPLQVPSFPISAPLSVKPDVLDKSVPLEDEYGAASYSSPASFIGEWGGQPYPVRDYQDMDYSVAYSPRKLMNMSGPNGTFYGPQQTAWESDYTDPVVDYQSVIYLGGGTAA